MNYKQEYTKHKNVYEKLKKMAGGKNTYDCSDKEEIVCENADDGFWDDLDECENSYICKENFRIRDADDESSRQKKESIELLRKNHKILNMYGVNDYYDDDIQDPHFLREILERITFIEENKKHFEKYGMYRNKKNDYIPHLDHLQDILESILLIEEYEELFDKYQVYSYDHDGSRIPDANYLRNILESILLIEENKRLFDKYQVYSYDRDRGEIPDLNYLRDMTESIILIEKYKRLFEEYQVYSYDRDRSEIPYPDYLRNMSESIILIEKNGSLFDKYQVYSYDHDGSRIPNPNYLRDMLRIINLIEKNKNMFRNYRVYNLGTTFQDSYDLKDLEDMFDLINMIEENKIPLKKYGMYKEGDVIPASNILKKYVKFIGLIKKTELFKGRKENETFKYDDVKNMYVRYMLDNYPQLREYDGYKGYKNDYILKSKTSDQIIDDIIQIMTVHDDCKIDQYPESFNISGLRSFSVYRNDDLNKIIYLLGEQHTNLDICDEKEDDDYLPPTYKADDFFFSLLNCFVPNNNKLDVFMEMPYNLTHNYKFISELYYDDTRGYMHKTFYRLYEENCRPSHIKKLFNDNKICKYGYVRFHHGDPRQSGCIFVSYVRTCWQLLDDPGRYFGSDKKISEAIDKLSKDYSLYDSTKLLKAFQSSPFLSKIIKQIENIDTKDVNSFFVEEFKDLVRFVKMNIQNITCDRVKPQFTNPGPQKNAIFAIIHNIFIKIMDLYLMSRVFRSFKTETSYTASNIIIYAGIGHIDNYIAWLEKLKFRKIVSSKKTKNRNCIQVDDFKYENLVNRT